MTRTTVFLETVPLLSRPSGIANYVAGLLQEFARQPAAVRCVSGLASWRPLSLAALQQACRDLAPTADFVRILCPNRVAVAAPRLAARWSRPPCPPVDIAHATANSFSSWLPPHARARVLTLHDVVPLRHRGGTMCSPALEAAMAARLPADCRRADLILTDSEFSKSEICDLLAIPPEKVVAVPLASSLQPSAGSRADAMAGLPPALEPFLLYVGSLDPRKNLGTLLDAFDAFRQGQPDTRLVMIGRPGWRGAEIVERLARTAGVTHLPTCDPDTLADLYQRARGAFLISWYEGFGLPVLEAMCLGCPVCYATGSSMGEVAGTAGLAVQPGDRDAVVEAMRLLWTDESRRRTLRDAGLNQARTFTWQRTAKATLAAYRTALERAR